MNQPSPLGVCLQAADEVPLGAWGAEPLLKSTCPDCEEWREGRPGVLISLQNPASWGNVQAKAALTYAGT